MQICHIPLQGEMASLVRNTWQGKGKLQVDILKPTRSTQKHTKTYKNQMKLSSDKYFNGNVNRKW